ncbi:F-box protein interaction domain protein [Medicago truncatula]|uniref:F-box protein interaction domain protein n=1 Tax=Medicago truncatula TaxID=3880 RepID=G7K747_MEDTR|nr:F-box protein interaction domain protein [Medicago truncatula]
MCCNHIPEDLALFILSKLPLKSLKRFGCVKKTWSLLFENSYFITMFRTNFISIPHSYYDDTTLILQEIVETPLKCYIHSLSGERFENRLKFHMPNPFQVEDPLLYILESGSTNGTLCLYGGPDELVLWNPSTDELNVVPSSSMVSMPPYRDPYTTLHGFGYDHVRDDYKIIRCIHFFLLEGEDLFRLNLSKEDVQRDEISYARVWEIYSLRCLLYTDGIWHWLSRNNAQHYMVSFDLSNHVLFKTLTPLAIPIDIDPNFDFENVSKELVMLNGSIALISWYEDTTTFHISVLGELGVSESWTKLFIIGPLSDLFTYPIGAGSNGDIFFKAGDGKLVFDLRTQMIEKLDGVEKFRVFSISCNGCPQTSRLQIECNSGIQLSDATCSSQTKQCSYTFQYGDGSGTSGYYVSDTMHLDTIFEGSDYKFFSSCSFLGDCSNEQSGDLTKSDRAVDGIFGFWQQQMSVISQLSSQGIASGVFSHCLRGDSSGGGIPVLGEIVEPNIVYTPIVPSRISVNGQALQVDPSVCATYQATEAPLSLDFEADGLLGVYAEIFDTILSSFSASAAQSRLRNRNIAFGMLSSLCCYGVFLIYGDELLVGGVWSCNDGSVQGRVTTIVVFSRLRA